MIKTAVLLTVYNRREVTLQGLRSLYKAIESLGDNYIFDIYMTDDGCTDGTADAVIKEFPDVVVVKGDGNLFWNRGMLKAWKAAIESKLDYDFYLWYNDDDDLNEDALTIMFSCYNACSPRSIISGAFCDNKGIGSYGGWSGDKMILPNNNIQQVDYINGNLVLVPSCVYCQIGKLDHHFHHSYGDWEYGIRAKRRNIDLFITPVYVGSCNRHDLKRCFNPCVNLIDRLKWLYSPLECNPSDLFFYVYKCNGVISAIKAILVVHLRCIFPIFWKKNK